MKRHLCNKHRDELIAAVESQNADFMRKAKQMAKEADSPLKLLDECECLEPDLHYVDGSPYKRIDSP